MRRAMTDGLLLGLLGRLGLLGVLLAACGPGETPIPPGVQQVHVVVTPTEVILSPTTVRAGDVYLVLDAPMNGSFVFVRQKSTAAATPGPLSDDDLGSSCSPRHPGDGDRGTGRRRMLPEIRTPRRARPLGSLRQRLRPHAGPGQVRGPRRDAGGRLAGRTTADRRPRNPALSGGDAADVHRSRIHRAAAEHVHQAGRRREAQPSRALATARANGWTSPLPCVAQQPAGDGQRPAGIDDVVHQQDRPRSDRGAVDRELACAFRELLGAVLHRGLRFGAVGRPSAPRRRAGPGARREHGRTHRPARGRVADGTAVTQAGAGVGCQRSRIARPSPRRAPAERAHPRSCRAGPRDPSPRRRTRTAPCPTSFGGAILPDRPRTASAAHFSRGLIVRRSRRRNETAARTSSSSTVRGNPVPVQLTQRPHGARIRVVQQPGQELHEAAVVAHVRLHLGELRPARGDDPLDPLLVLLPRLGVRR